MLDQFVFAFGITGPVLILLMLGWALLKINLINANFITHANALVFNVAMPAMLFFSISSSSFNEAIDVPLTLIGLFGTLALIGLLIVVGLVLPADQRGVFVQGSYRGNLAVLGVALALATFGDDVLPLVAIYIAVITTAYNIVAVWVLNSSGVLSKLIKNPILIGIVAGVCASAIELPIPTFLIATGSYLTDLTLPLALICIGATLEFKSIKDHSLSIGLAVLFKLIISPVLLVGLGLWFGLSDERLGVLFFMSASPTATASYIMARQMTQHGKLAAEIVAVTSVLGVITYTAGIILLRAMGLV